MILCFPLLFISLDRFKTESEEFRTGRKVEIFTRLRAAYVVFKKNNWSSIFIDQNAKAACLLTVQRTKIKFWSQLGAWLHEMLGTLKEKNPPREGKYNNFEMHNLRSPHISPGSPPLSDKCTTPQIIPSPNKDLGILSRLCVHLSYTCQLSRLRRESHAYGLKTSISRLLTPAGQFLTPDWKMW